MTQKERYQEALAAITALKKELRHAQDRVAFVTRELDIANKKATEEWRKIFIEDGPEAIQELRQTKKEKLKK